MDGKQGLTLYVCEIFACHAPVIGEEAILAALGGL